MSEKHKHSPLCIEIFFPEQSVKANPSFCQNGTSDYSVFQAQVVGDEVVDGQRRFFINVHVSSDNEADDAPYIFNMEGFGAFECASEHWEADRESMEAQAIQIVVGSLRERLASLTSRAPWGTFFFGVMRFNRRDDDIQPPVIRKDKEG